MFKVLSQNLSEENKEKHVTVSWRSGNIAKIQTLLPQNISLDHYWYTTLLSGELNNYCVISILQCNIVLYFNEGENRISNALLKEHHKVCQVMTTFKLVLHRNYQCYFIFTRPRVHSLSLAITFTSFFQQTLLRLVTSTCEQINEPSGLRSEVLVAENISSWSG